VTTSAIRRRYGWGAARLTIEAQPIRWEETPSILPNATSGAATVLIGGLAVFALVRSIQPPDELPSEIQIVQLQEPEPPPEPEPELAPEPEPPPPEEKPEPPPEPVVMAQVTPPPKPEPVKRKPDPPKRKAPPPMPKPEPVAVKPAPEPEPQWKRVALAPPPPKPVQVTPPPAVRKPPPVQIEPPKPMPEPTESAPAWKPVAIAQAPKPKPAMPAPHVTIDAVNTPSSAPPELPSRSQTLPPGVPAAPKTVRIPPNVKPAVLAAAPLDVPNDSASGPASYARNVPAAPSAPAVAKRLPPKGGVAMPGIGNASASESAAVAGDARGFDRVGVKAPPAPTGRSEPNAKLRGVPLGSLAACRSDKLEDDLKQKVLAAVRNREECASAAGRYRFVETKNLNAFLMWIERAQGRAEGDRCAELSYALSCLRGGAR
jgi:hypothetical protein